MVGIFRLVLKISIACFGVVFLSFISIDSLSGDSATFIAGIHGDVDTVRRQLGLDLPLFVRFKMWFVSVISGDFGTSYVYGDSVSEIVLERFFITLPLAIASFVLSMIFGLVMGVLLVLYNSSVVRIVTVLFLAMPPIWLGLLCVSLFVVSWQILPSGGSDSMSHYVLPSVVLGLSNGAIFARYVYTALNQVRHKKFIYMAQLRGLSFRHAMLKHGIASVSGSLLGILGLQIGFLLTGVVVIERFFAMPGLGDLLYQSILMRDIAVASATVSVMALIVIIVNSIAEVLVYSLTPALRRGYND